MVKHFSAHTSCCFRDLHSALPREQTPCRAQPQHPSAERHLQPSKDPARLQGVYPWRLKYVKANRASCPSRCLHGTSQEFYHEHNDDAAAAASSRRPKSPAANTELCSFGTAFQSSGAPGTGELQHTRFPGRLRLLLSPSALERERAARPGREQGTCTSEACGTTGFKTGQNKALRHHAKVLNYCLQLSGTLHPFSTKPTTAEKPLEMEERLAYGRKGFINSI